jgi:hypothetical protein
MRIVVEDQIRKVAQPGEKGMMSVLKDTTVQAKRVAFGREDLFLAFIVILLLAGFVAGKITFEQTLAYFGVTTSGGVWGLISGNASEK